IQAVIYKLSYTSCHIQAVIYKLSYTSCHIQAVIYKLSYTSCHIQAVIYKLSYTSCHIQAVIYKHGCKPRVGWYGYSPTRKYSGMANISFSPTRIISSLVGLAPAVLNKN